MKKLHVFASALIVVLLLASCGLSGNGFGGNSIQKRKYTKGFYFNKNRHYHGQDEHTSGDNPQISDEQNFATTDETVTPLRVRSADPSLISEEKSIEKGKQHQPQQRQEEKKKKASNSQVRKDAKTTTTRQRKQREHEFYIPMKEKRQEMKAAASSSDTGMLILLVILCFIIPPLAVFIFEGATSRFWIDLVLTILGFGIGFWLIGGSLGWLCALAAVIYALLIVLGVI